MAFRAYVGNLTFSFTPADLEQLFKDFGRVRAVQIISDRESGRSRGFGFVELETGEQLQAAIGGLHGKSVEGRNLIVTEARERVAGGPGAHSGAGPPRERGPAESVEAPRANGVRPTRAPDMPSSGAPRSGFGDDAAPSGAPARRERERTERKPRLDDYNRSDKRWRRGGEDWE